MTSLTVSLPDVHQRNLDLPSSRRDRHSYPRILSRQRGTVLLPLDSVVDGPRDARRLIPSYLSNESPHLRMQWIVTRYHSIGRALRPVPPNLDI